MRVCYHVYTDDGEINFHVPLSESEAEALEEWSYLHTERVMYSSPDYLGYRVVMGDKSGNVYLSGKDVLGCVCASEVMGSLAVVADGVCDLRTGVQDVGRIRQYGIKLSDGRYFFCGISGGLEISSLLSKCMLC